MTKDAFLKYATQYSELALFSDGLVVIVSKEALLSALDRVSLKGELLVYDQDLPIVLRDLYRVEFPEPEENSSYFEQARWHPWILMLPASLAKSLFAEKEGQYVLSSKTLLHIREGHTRTIVRDIQTKPLNSNGT